MRFVFSLVVVGLFGIGLAAEDASAQAYVSYYAPAPMAPVPTTTAYYAPRTAYYAPTTTYYTPAPVASRAVVSTRYRPLLGGSITRVRYHYAPVAPVTYVAPAPARVDCCQ